MKTYLFYGVAALLLFSCQKTERSTPFSGDDAVPGEISNAKVKNIPGGATISYTLPDSKSLLYVLAEYTIEEGVTKTQKASYYTNNMTLEGFPNTSAREIKLYAVSRGEKKSSPVTITINPLTPPVFSVFQSIKMRPTFGGVNIEFENPTGADIKINVVTLDSLKELTTADVFYTSILSGNFSVRGYDSIPRRFGVFVRDRWNNYSDTVFAEVTPFYESKLDRLKFSSLRLPGDTWQQHTGFKPETAVWDGLEAVGASAFHTAPGSGLPQWFTINLGQPSILSRFKFFHRMNSAYAGGDPKVFEIWGSNNPPVDGSWTNWQLLGHFVNTPLSGEIPATAEDVAYAQNSGTDYEFPEGNPAYQYIRFKTLETWGGVDYIFIGELTFWGSAQ